MKKLNPSNPEDRSRIRFRMLNLMPFYSAGEQLLVALGIGLLCAGACSLALAIVGSCLFAPRVIISICCAYGFTLGFMPQISWFCWGKWWTKYYEHLLASAA